MGERVEKPHCNRLLGFRAGVNTNQVDCNSRIMTEIFWEADPDAPLNTQYMLAAL